MRVTRITGHVQDCCGAQRPRSAGGNVYWYIVVLCSDPAKYCSKASREWATCCGAVCIHRAPQVEALLALLDDETRAKLEQRVTDSARSFTPANPSGYYRLDLSKQPEREVALRLMEIRNAEIEDMKKLPRPKGELAVNKTTASEHHIRNASLDSNAFVFTSAWRLPNVGLLSFDFTSTSKPPPGSKENAVDLAPVLRGIKGNEERLLKVKELLGVSYITLKTAKHCFMLMKGTEARVAFLVLAFARIIEWHGFHDLTDLLTKHELPQLHKRLGLHNVYDPFSSVGYWEMQLENPEHRVVAAHLVRLAVLEPGDNVEDAWCEAAAACF